MATGLNWCGCYASKIPYNSAGYFYPNFSYQVEAEKWRGNDHIMKDPRIVPTNELQEKDEELSDDTQETQPSTARRRRATYKRWQLNILEDAFDTNCYPSTMFKRFLAARLEMENIQVQVWFQNRRARMKKDGNERTSLYGRSYPPTLRYYETQRSPMTRASPYTYYPRRPVVTPMFPGYDSDHGLRHSHPGFSLCSPPRAHEACDVTVKQLLSDGKK